MELIEVHTVNGIDIFLAYFPKERGNKKYYSSYTSEGNVVRFKSEKLERMSSFDFKKPSSCNFPDGTILETETQARKRMNEMIKTAPLVIFIIKQPND